LPHDNGRFDVATACNALRYAEDQLAALAELVRVVRPGGRLAIGDWADPVGSLTRDFVGRLGVADLTSTLAAHVRAAGLDRLDGSELHFPVTYPDLPTTWSAMIARGCVADAVDTAGKDAVYEIFTDVFAPARRADGSIRDENAFRYLIAAKPV
jgi:SAM-dependent methyltransferase